MGLNDGCTTVGSMPMSRKALSTWSIESALSLMIANPELSAVIPRIR
ncbi:hypothetical protein SCE1572_46365 [Sorangium cellulosum So0157-2]|uniref:Uncharacterized protein n=1 Tax=Sorangium cellulosum So0157-2 TaxID=1254432 RepID=S4YAE4_SORCE|nr:hypothetical protein SCE1572_46365 [Sorangium cellulosum So0157-2]